MLLGIVDKKKAQKKPEIELKKLFRNKTRRTLFNLD
jgi:hypothetical protein